MGTIKKLYDKSKKNHSLTADTVSYIMYKFGYGDINLAGANSRYKTFTKLEKEFKGLVGKTEFTAYDEDMSDVVWICWLQGIENAPQLVRHCVSSIEHHITDRRIIYISKDNFRDYCEIPPFIIEKWEKGIITNTHFSDILRLALLIRHGGLWLDATVYLTDALPEYITDGDFFVYRDGFFNCDVINFGSWIIYAAAPNHVLLNEALALTYAYWRKYDYMKHYFLLHLLFRIVTDCYPEEWNGIPYYSQMDQHIFSFEITDDFSEKRWKQLAALTPLHKLSNKLDIGNAGADSYYAKLGELYKNNGEAL